MANQDYVSISSAYNPDAFLRMDGSGVNSLRPVGGVVNCQNRVEMYEKFRLTKLPDGFYIIESVAFPNVFLRMDGTDVNNPDADGNGTVNCEHSPNSSWLKFKFTKGTDGTYTIESVAFPNVFLRMDARNVYKPEPGGSGIVNCQYTPLGPFEKFLIDGVVPD